MAQRVRDIMTKDPIELEPSATIAEAAAAMRDADVGALLVRKHDGSCGIVTDRDLVVRGLADSREGAALRTVGEVCSDAESVSPDDDADDVLRLMRDRAVRRVPVVEGRRAVGIVSLGDLAADRDRGSVLGEISAARPTR